MVVQSDADLAWGWLRQQQIFYRRGRKMTHRFVAHNADQDYRGGNSMNPGTLMHIGLDKIFIALVLAFFWWQTRSSQRP
jgi:hypothetical protein